MEHPGTPFETVWNTLERIWNTPIFEGFTIVLKKLQK